MIYTGAIGFTKDLQDLQKMRRIHKGFARFQRPCKIYKGIVGFTKKL